MVRSPSAVTKTGTGPWPASSAGSSDGVTGAVLAQHDPGGGDVVEEHLAEVVRRHLAEEPDASPEGGDTGGGVGGRAPRDLDGGAHSAVHGVPPGRGRPGSSTP